MPRFDGTGPLGQGPRTGRGLGPCGRNLAALEDKEQLLERELAAVREEKASLQKES